MSSKVPNYSKTSIYKLCCKDPTITDIYVGHTTNFKNRKNCHKTRCNTELDKSYNSYLYQFIREHGGFENWDMIEICNIVCVDKRDAERNERKYIEDLGSSLNKQVPTRTQQEWKKNNRERINENIRKYNTTPQRQEYVKKYKEINKEQISEYHKNKRIEKGEQAILERREYYNNNREYLCMKERERYAKKKLLKETINEDLNENV